MHNIINSNLEISIEDCVQDLIDNGYKLSIINNDGLFSLEKLDRNKWIVNDLDDGLTGFKISMKRFFYVRDISDTLIFLNGFIYDNFNKKIVKIKCSCSLIPKEYNFNSINELLKIEIIMDKIEISLK